MNSRIAVAITPAALALPLLAFVVMRQAPSIDPVWAEPTVHFWVVSLCTVISAGIATGLALCIRSVRTTRTVYLALGFVGVAAIFATHGLSTPGFIVPVTEQPYAVVISAGLSQIVGAAFIALSVMPTRSRAGRLVERIRVPVVAVALAAIGTYVYVAMADPERLEFIPISRRWDGLLAAGTMLMLGYSAYRYWRAWRLTRFPAQAAMVCALVLLAESQVSMYYGTLWHASWWMYHMLMLVAFLVLVAGWAYEAQRAKSLLLFSRAVALRDELDGLTLPEPEALDALESAMDEKDAYTRHHMGRVADLSAAIAREMGLDAETVRLAEIAGRVHDIGKIAVPDTVLLKPGKLTDREYAQMKHHAARGENIARSSKVLAGVSEIVRAHHERFAGGGYPDGLAGESIPIAARIIAVADTYDALTSPRVYRAARPAGPAMQEIERVSGTQLDPRCVEAFKRVLVRLGELPGQAIAPAA